MTHLSSDQLTDAYYGDLDATARGHLEDCAACRADFDRLQEVLNAVKSYPVPPRSDAYGREVWARLQPRLRQKGERRWFQIWTLVPITVALCVAVFVAGMMTQEHRQSKTLADARERILLMAMSDHFERSQIILAQLLNATPGEVSFRDERDRARDLLDENRLLRQTALHAGDSAHAALLDELERILLNIANGPSEMSAADLAALQRRIESEGLLFKVRISSADTRETGRKL
ncbi:MAG: hypothetical protein JOZ62_23875 [Acidobacteriaceae bacterium]|nr:hypothetical protein [Acidobacteriaceae bacterium]